MKLELTATTNLERATIKDANSAKMHNQHDPNVEHDNVQILSEDTELNKHTVLLNRNDVLEEQYGKMIQERNEKTRQRFLDGKIGQNEYQNRLTNVEKYLNSDGKKPKQALTNYVFTLGNVETEFKMLDALGFKYERQKVKDSEGKYHDRPKLTDLKQRKEFANIMNDTYVSLAKKINNTNAGLKVVDCWVHMDEGGMPHCQGEMVNCGHTKSGKPSYNLNQALGEFNQKFGKDVYTSRSTNKQGKQSKSPNGRVALREFRQIIDSNMVTTFNQVLTKRRLNGRISATMVRLGKRGGLTMDEYQHRKQAQDELKQTYEALTGKKAVGKDNAPLSSLETARRLQSASKAIKKQKKEAEAKEAENSANEAKLEQQIADEKFNSFVRQHFIERLNQRRLQRLRQREEQFDRDQNQIKNSLVDEIREYDPEHCVEAWLLNEGEKPQQVKTDVGRQQHRRQNIKYLFDTAKQAVEKSFTNAKDRAMAVVDKFVKDLIPETESQKANRLGSHILVGTISRSNNRIDANDAKREIKLMNDPAIRVKKALAMASSEQINNAKQKLFKKSKSKDSSSTRLPGDDD